MTKNEALKAAIDGAKVKCNKWIIDGLNDYVFWDGKRFMYQSRNEPPEEVEDAIDIEDGWEICPKTISFDEAIQAWKQGKRIQSSGRDMWGKPMQYQREDNPFPAFCLSEIRGQWQILE